MNVIQTVKKGLAANIVKKVYTVGAHGGLSI